MKIEMGNYLKTPFEFHSERPSRPATGSWAIASFSSVCSRRAFSLLELIVVLSIIVILGTMGMIGYQSSVPPGAVRAARSEIHGLLRFAREQAIMKGTNSMLIINYDKTDRDKFLRYVGVIVEEEYNSTNWKASHSGIYLPEGVYLVPQSVDVDDGFDFDAEWPLSGADPDVRSQYHCSNGVTPKAIGAIEYPVLDTIALDASSGEEQDWIGYQFGPDGRVKGVDFDVCSSAAGSQSNHLVLGLASYQASGELLFEDSEKAVGVIVRLNGVSYAVDDPDAL